MNWLFPDTLKGRLVVTYAILAIALTAIVGYLLIRSGNELREENTQSLLIDQASIAAAIIGAASGNSGQVDGDLLPGKGLDGGVSRYVIIDSTSLDSPPDTVTITRTSTGWTTIAPIAGTTYSLVVETDESALPGGSGGARRDLLLLAAIAAALAAASSALIANRIAKPLEQLRQQASAVSGGDYTTEVVPQPPEEIAELAKAFNAMTNRVQLLISEGEAIQNRLTSIISNLTDGVLVVDDREVVLAANPRAQELLQVTNARAAGQSMVVVTRDHDLTALMERALQSGTTGTATIEHTASRRIIDATAIPVASSGQRIGVLLLRDVTDLRRLESVRREFVANVSHELKTPLASIRAMVETLEAGAIDDPGVAADFLHRVIGEVDRLTQLVEELLDLGRLESGREQLQLRIVEPGQLLERAASRLQSQIDRAGLTIAIDLPEALAKVLVDTARIDQVLMNLVHNAVKFTPRGGAIILSARDLDRMVEFAVADTGAGIPPDELDRVFERFYKADKARRSEGSGLGLAIAKHIVAAHGGTLTVSSESGHGSEFRFTLPVAPGSAGSTP